MHEKNCCLPCKITLAMKGMILVFSSCLLEEHMSQFLEELKTRHADALKRLQAAQQKMATAQAELQAVSQEYNSLQHLANIEAAKIQQPAGEPITVNVSSRIAPPALPHTSETNKTETIRELLRQHPAGMTPTDIWKEVKGQMVHRPYLYSILKRLKDKDEVCVRRGKYIAKMTPKPEEGKGQTMVQ
jgi:hypothetical protein